jgi:hypothetical protein
MMTDTNTPERKIFTIDLGDVTSEQALEIIDRVKSEILLRDASNYDSNVSEANESFILSGAAEQLAKASSMDELSTLINIFQTEFDRKFNAADIKTFAQLDEITIQRSDNTKAKVQSMVAQINSMLSKIALETGFFRGISFRDPYDDRAFIDSLSYSADDVLNKLKQIQTFATYESQFEKESKKHRELHNKLCDNIRELNTSKAKEAAEHIADKITETRSPEQIEHQAVIEAETMIALSKQP